MKKIASILICLSMLFSFSLTAFSAGGLGTEASPYLISTAEELQAITSELNSSYRLMNDIDLNGFDFAPIGDASSGAFTGSFDGNGYKILNLSIISSGKYTGLFGYCDGEIKNLTLENAEVEGGRYTGGLAGYLDINGKISSSSVSGSVIGTCTVISAFAGGVAGYCAGEINDCINNASVSSCAGVENTYSASGGIVGFCTGTVSGCNNNSVVKAFADTDYTYTIAGGIIGILDSNNKIDGCINKGSVSSDINRFQFYEKYKSGDSYQHDYYYRSYAGGIIGQSISSEANIGECINDGSVTISGERKSSSGWWHSYRYTTYIGGIIGTSENLTIQNCENNYMFSTKKFFTAGLVGYSSDLTMTDCCNMADIFSETNTAGMVYECDTALIKNSVNYGKISSNYAAAGIVCNADTVEFIGCDNYGDVSVVAVDTTSPYAGGFVCWGGDLTVSECSNYGNIYIENNVHSSSYCSNYAGGIAASSNNVDISKTQNIGTVSVVALNGYPRVYIGGLCGAGVGTVSECQVLGDVKMNSVRIDGTHATTQGYAGGLIGGGGDVTDCSVFGDVLSTSGDSYAGPLGGSKSVDGYSNYYIGTVCAQGVNLYPNALGIDYISEDSLIWGTDFSSKLTETEMKNSESFVGFDFDNIWISDPNVNNGYPTLRYFYNDLILSKQYINLKITDTVSLKAFNFGKEQNVEWSSTDETVATVSEDGLVTPVSSGNVKIIAKDSNGKQAMCVVNVKAESDGIVLEDINVNIGKTIYLTPSNLADENIVKWESSNESVATVTANGLTSAKITAKSAGSTTITVTSTYGNTASCVVTVTSYVTSISLPNVLTVNRGSSKNFGSLYVRPYPTQSTLTWTSTDNNVASVDENGVVTGVSCGKAIISVESDNGFSDVCTVTVDAPVESLIMEKGSITVTKGFTDKVVVIPDPVDTTDTIKYSSDRSSIVSVDSTGIITGLYPGTATITATSTSGKKAYCVVTVEDVENPVAGIALDREEININKGELITLLPTVLPSNATNKQIVWSVEDSSIATVSQTGVVKGISGGSTTVRATTSDGGYTAECIVNVVVNVDSVALSLTEETLNIGETTALEAVISPANATNKNVSWSSSDENIAAVDENGIVTAASKGSATITVTTEDGAKNTTCVITVTEPVTAVEMSQSSATVALNETLQLSASVEPSETKYTDIVWSSNDETVATVSETGVVTAHKLGIATITALAHNGINAVCEIYVVAFEGAEYTEFECEKTADGTSVMITAYCGTSSDVVIPKAIGSLPVTSLGANLFADCEHTIDTLTITETVTEIATGSFDSSVGKVLCYENSAAHTYCESNGINYEFIVEMTVNPSSVIMTKGNGKQLSVSITPSTMADTAITWSSSNISIATVDENGYIKAVKMGNATITATDENGNTATCKVRVNPSTPTIVIYNFSHSYEQKLDLWERYSKATMKLGFHSYNCEDAVRFEWSSSNHRVKIDENGNITNTGFFGRSSTITIKAYNAEGKVVAKNSVKVMFYKFKWQQERLQSQSIASDNYLNRDIPEEELEISNENELVAFFSYFIEYIEKIFKLIVSFK